MDRLCGWLFVKLLRRGLTGCSLPRRVGTGNMCPCFHYVRDRRGARIVVDNEGILVFNSGSCLNLAGRPGMVRTTIRTAHGCNANYTKSHFLGNALSLRLRLRGRLTRFINGRSTVVCSAKFRMGLNIISYIANHRSCIVYSRLSRTSVIRKHHLSFSAVLGFGRGSVRSLRGRLRGYHPSTIGLVMMSKMFDVRNSVTGLPRVIHLSGGCSTGVVMSRTRNLKILNGRKHNAYSRFKLAGRISLVVNAFDGSLTTVNNFVTTSRSVVGCLHRGSHSCVFDTDGAPTTATTTHTTLRVVGGRPRHVRRL